ncbi:MAG: hypothetical protein EOO60_06970, partial [Hymenobacter sp.]
MKIPFLRNLPGLNGPPVRQVALSSSQPQALVAATALHQLLAELPELLLAAVLEVGSGQLLATYASERSYQPAPLAAPLMAIVQQLQASYAAQPALRDEQLHEVLLTLAGQLHLLRLCPGGQYLLYLAVDAHDTNLALARALVQQATDQLTKL